MITGLLITPNGAPEVVSFEEGYRPIQQLVEGSFEYVGLFDDADVIVNEEGKINGSAPNRFLLHDGKLVDILFGNILLTDSDQDGNTVSLSKDKLEKYRRIFSQRAIII